MILKIQVPVYIFKLRAITCIFLIILITGFQKTHAQQDTTVNKKRLTGLIIGGATAYTAGMVGLYQLWYKDYPQSSFHFTNDNREWMGLDKLGHVTTSYWIGRISHDALRWAGVKHKHATWYGGCAGLFFLTTVEIFDGFSAEWGASGGDIIANIAGAALFIGQQLTWKEQRVLIKFSYHPTEYADYRPDVLGSSTIERVIKDYNGQTYWLSVNIHSFLKPESRFPKWLNVSPGYSAKGMLGGSENSSKYENEELPEFKRTPQFFLTLDVDMTRIPTRSKFLKGLFTILGFIKIPFPTIEYNPEDHFKFYYLYF
jgi:hypothetical protein